MVNALRLGVVSYLNAEPLVYGLEKDPAFDLQRDVPSRVAERLHAGEIDLGMIPSIEYLRRAGVAPDERVAESIDLVASKRDGDGRWPLENQHPGTMAVEVDEGEGRPSRWNTLRALRVLDWYSARD